MTLAESPHGAVRFGQALRWLSNQDPSCPLLVLAPSLDAGRDLVRAATTQKGAIFGWALESLGSLAVQLSAVPLSALGQTLAPPLALEAVCVRVVSELKVGNKLGRLQPIGDRPGLPGALLRTFSELGQAGVDPETVPAELGDLYRQYRAALSSLGLADRSGLFQLAIQAARASQLAPLGLPLCMYDIAPRTRLERDLLAELIRRAPRAFATIPSNDSACATLLPLVGKTVEAETALATSDVQAARTALQRLQGQLFSSNELAGAPDESVSILSAPGESREAVEIARRILAEAERGVPFDRMAILLRSPFHYRTHLLEALRRAAIPAFFAREAARPDPAGRALLVLLECAADGISATRFAEYLSLGVVPDRAAEHPHASGDGAMVVSHDEETVRFLHLPESGDTPVLSPAKNLSLPRRWESLLVDAAVIGGAARWHRRLDTLARSLEVRKLSPDDGVRWSAERELGALQELRAFALPIVDLLGALPSSATWGTWLDALNELAKAAVDAPAHILSVLAQLEIVREVGTVELKDVLGTLKERLGEVHPPPRARQSGEVLIASVDEARGRVFDVVFVPGLAEKLFPQRVVEDPLLSDTSREAISPDLETQTQRVANERAALAIAVGAARHRVVLSYPRFESDKARPRVPSFYALEALRAAEGRLPSFAELARRADEASQTRMGWPAPQDASNAIDASEYDLSRLRQFLRGKGKEAEGAAHYLLTANPRLRRALQFRARRWRPEWRYVDGLVEPNSLAREALAARHARLLRRGFAVTALEKYAACPYRFYLATVVGLRARKVSVAVEELDPATRGLLIHQMMRAVGVELHGLGLFSNETDFVEAKRVLLGIVNRESAVERERLAPAIPRVWDDAILDIGTDLVGWLQVTRESGWQPVAFEHEFGQRGASIPDQASAPITLDFGLPLRGVIDAIEQSGGALRATDYKTGTAPEPGTVVSGGRLLQPTLYSLVIEQLFPHSTVTGGNAFYSTTKGGFTRNEVTLDERSREAAGVVHRTIAAAFEDGFFPAAPAEKTCEHCDFRRICGPYERERVQRKEATRLESLQKLRAIP